MVAILIVCAAPITEIAWMSQLSGEPIEISARPFLLAVSKRLQVVPEAQHTLKADALKLTSSPPQTTNLQRKCSPEKGSKGAATEGG